MVHSFDKMDNAMVLQGEFDVDRILACQLFRDRSKAWKTVKK